MRISHRSETSDGIGDGSEHASTSPTEPIHPGAVRVAGIGKTNTKDSIVSLMSGSSSKKDEGVDETEASSKFMITRKDSANTDSNRIGSISRQTDTHKEDDVDESASNGNNDGTVTAKAISQEELEQEVLQKYNLQQQHNRGGGGHLTDVEQPRQTVSPLPEAAMAVVVTKHKINDNGGKNKKWCIATAIIAIVAVVVIVVVFVGKGGSTDGASSELQHDHDSHDDGHHDSHDDHDSHDHDSSDHSIGLPTEPTLQRIQERGYLKCRVAPKDIDVGHGLSVELVRTNSFHWKWWDRAV